MGFSRKSFPGQSLPTPYQAGVSSPALEYSNRALLITSGSSQRSLQPGSLESLDKHRGTALQGRHLPSWAWGGVQVCVGGGGPGRDGSLLMSPRGWRDSLTSVAIESLKLMLWAFTPVRRTCSSQHMWISLPLTLHLTSTHAVVVSSEHVIYSLSYLTLGITGTTIMMYPRSLPSLPDLGP